MNTNPKVPIAKNKCEYNWSDAWLLLAIVYAGSGGANLQKIVAIGDVIEHAIFNADELESGLARLTSGGYIKEHKGVFAATSKVMKAYAKTTSPRRRIYKELEDMQELIGAASPSSEQPQTNNLKYPRFSKKSYQQAVNRYIEGFGKK